MPSIFFFRCLGAYPGGAAEAKCTKLSGCSFFFALYLILGGKLHSWGRDDLFFALQIRFLTL